MKVRQIHTRRPRTAFMGHNRRTGYVVAFARRLRVIKARINRGLSI